MCIKKCDGMFVTSYSKESFDLANHINGPGLAAYNKFKKRFKGIEGNVDINRI